MEQARGINSDQNSADNPVATTVMERIGAAGIELLSGWSNRLAGGDTRAGQLQPAAYLYAALALSEKAPHLRTQPINSSNLAILFCSWKIWNVLASGSKAITISPSRLSRQTPTSSLWLDLQVRTRQWKQTRLKNWILLKKWAETSFVLDWKLQQGFEVAV